MVTAQQNVVRAAIAAQIEVLRMRPEGFRGLDVNTTNTALAIRMCVAEVQAGTMFRVESFGKGVARFFGQQAWAEAHRAALVAQSMSPKAQVLRLREQEGGFRMEDIDGNRSSVQHYLERAMRDGWIFKATLQHSHVRYYGTKAEADAAVPGPDPMRRAKPRAKRPDQLALAEPVAHVHKSRRAPWDDDAPAHYPVDAQGRPLYKVTVAPTPAAALRTNTFSRFG